MDKFDVLKDTSKELYESPMSIPLGKFEFANPYSVIQRTEYINQAPLMIAMMMNEKIEHDGKEVNLWEGFTEDGTWDTDNYGDIPTEKVEKIVKHLRNKIDQLNKMNHGNYDPISAIGAKSTLLGRALSQFRTWLYEGVAVRFEGEKVDALLGVRKGRYRSAVDFFNEHGAKTTATALLKGMAKNLSFGMVLPDADFNEYGNENVKEVDIANMRKILAEALMFVGIATSYMILKNFAKGLDDEEDKHTRFVVNTLINQGQRLKTDIIFYLHPSELKNLTRDLIPSLSVIKDVSSFMGSTMDFISGNDEITTGVHAG
jgi:hypothetical protein